MTEKDEVRGHKFDGIEEYDNDLPRWWISIFWVTGIFSVFYIAWVHLGFRDSDDVRLRKDLASLEVLRNEVASKSVAASGAITEDKLVALASDTSALSKGKEVFTGKCSPCHGQNGEGLIGPNLTDDYWIHGGKILDIRNLILKGVPEKGMLSWQGLLTEEELNSVVAFIWSIHGSNPPNPKSPGGELAQPG